jgi:hypothetical protein
VLASRAATDELIALLRELRVAAGLRQVDVAERRPRGVAVARRRLPHARPATDAQARCRFRLIAAATVFDGRLLLDRLAKARPHGDHERTHSRHDAGHRARAHGRLTSEGLANTWLAR